MTYLHPIISSSFSPPVSGSVPPSNLILIRHINDLMPFLPPQIQWSNFLFFKKMEVLKGKAVRSSSFPL